MLRINNLKIRKDLTEKEIFEFAISKFHINKNDIINMFISRKSIDARKKDDVFYSYSIDLEVKNEQKYKKLEKIKVINLPQIEIKRNSKISIIEKYFKEVLNENKWQKIPVISSICSMGNYFVFGLFLIVLILYRKKYKYLIPISIYVGIYITLFLSPVALYRYVYSIVISIPLLTLILYKTYLKNQN